MFNMNACFITIRTISMFVNMTTTTTTDIHAERITGCISVTDIIMIATITANTINIIISTTSTDYYNGYGES